MCVKISINYSNTSPLHVLRRLNSSMSVVYSYVCKLITQSQKDFLPQSCIVVVIIESLAFSLLHRNVLRTMTLILYVLYIHALSYWLPYRPETAPLRVYTLHNPKNSRSPSHSCSRRTVVTLPVYNLVSAYTLYNNNPDERLDKK